MTVCMRNEAAKAASKPAMKGGVGASRIASVQLASPVSGVACSGSAGDDAAAAMPWAQLVCLDL